jgi:putative flavoprotein involved in K+ transport
LMGKATASRIGRRMREHNPVLIGSSPRGLRRRHGVQLHQRATNASGSTVTFSDRTELTVSAVIWATGFGVDHSWIELPVIDRNGEVVHERGVTASPGLYFLGLPWQHTSGSALLGWVKDDARYLTQHISTYQRSLTEGERHDSDHRPVPRRDLGPVRV